MRRCDVCSGVAVEILPATSEAMELALCAGHSTSPMTASLQEFLEVIEAAQERLARAGWDPADIFA